MRVTVFISATLLALLSFHAHGALERVSDFAMLDNAGKFHQLSRYRHKDALVIMAYGDSCQFMSESLSAYKTLQQNRADGNVEFLLIDSQNLGREQLAQTALGLPVLSDGGQLISESLGIKHAGEVLILNPDRLSLYYRGDVEGADQVLEDVLSDSLVDTVRSAIDGCEIDYPMQAKHQTEPPDYTSEIAPIVAENCAGCHRLGGVGPFAFDSYIMLLGWSPMIREVLMNKRMPPMQVDPHVGLSASARHISDENIQSIVHWIDNGAPRGEGEVDPLEQLNLEEVDQWQLGVPDYVVTAPENEVPSTGVLDYSYRYIDLPFEEDKWLKAVQYKAGEEAVLHHLMTFVVGPEDDFWGPEREQESAVRRFVAGYAPGNDGAVEYAPGTAVYIPQGHRLAMQFHYVTNGQSAKDVTQLGLYFLADSEIEPLPQEQLTQVLSPRFVLAPNNPEHLMQTQHTFDKDVVLTGVRARMSFRGKYMNFTLVSPDGDSTEFFSIPAYNYGWQPHYELEEPMLVPAGSTIEVNGAFDNSISNPSNPDPDKEIIFGVESWDEMFAAYLSFHEL